MTNDRNPFEHKRSRLPGLALAATLGLGAGMQAEQQLHPDCATYDRQSLTAAHDLAREYARVAQKQLVFIGDPEIGMYFEGAGISSPADVTDQMLDDLQAVLDNAAALDNVFEKTERLTRCSMMNASGARLHVVNEARTLLNNIMGGMMEFPERFQHLEKHRPLLQHERPRPHSVPYDPFKKPEPVTA